MSVAGTLLRSFAEDHPAEAARLLGGQPPAGAAALLATLPHAPAAAVLERMAPQTGAACVAELDAAQGAALLEHLAAERAAALLRRLDDEPREALLAVLKNARRLRPLLLYPEDTAAALMDPHVLALPDDLDLDEARERVGRHGTHVALELYVVDREQRLRGLADLRQVLDAARRGPLASLVRPLEPLRAAADLTAIAAHAGWNEHGTLPVVDERGVYLGALRHERLRQLQSAAVAGRARGGVEAVVALGELYWIGLSGLFTGLASPGGPRGRQAEEEA